MEEGQPGRKPCYRAVRSACGACAGLALFATAVILLVWNEFKLVQVEDFATYVLDSVLETECGVVHDSNNGKPVWASCKIESLWDFARDGRVALLQPLFGSATERSQALMAAWVNATSEIFQWFENKECRKEPDGHEDCTYSYERAWMPAHLDSSAFGCFTDSIACLTPSGVRVDPQNSGSIPAILQEELVAPSDEVRVGGYGLNSAQVLQLTSTCSLSEPNRTEGIYVPGVVDSRPIAILEGTRYKFVQQVGLPDSIGDVRTSFKKSAVNLSSVLSVVGLQHDTRSNTHEASLLPWDAHYEEAVNWAVEGNVSLAGMVRLRLGESSRQTLWLRLAGAALALVSLQVVIFFLAMCPQAESCCGPWIREISCGHALCCVSLPVSIAVWLTVVGVAWSVARPAYGLVSWVVAALLLSAVACNTSRISRMILAKDPPLLLQSVGGAEEAGVSSNACS